MSISEADANISAEPSFPFWFALTLSIRKPCQSSTTNQQGKISLSFLCCHSEEQIVIHIGYFCQKSFSRCGNKRPYLLIPAITALSLQSALLVLSSCPFRHVKFLPRVLAYFSTCHCNWGSLMITHFNSVLSGSHLLCCTSSILQLMSLFE